MKSSLETLKPRISVAPMMDWTTKDYRFFARLFNPNVVLYTEMVTTGAILFGDAKRHLDYSHEEHPIVLQWVVPIPKIWPNVPKWHKIGAMMKSISMSAVQVTVYKTIKLAHV